MNKDRVKIRKQILEEFLSNIYIISDKNYQRQIWISGTGPQCDDFDETVTHFFHEGDAILDNYKEFHITESQYKFLKDFRDKFDAFATEHDLPVEFIDTPEWEKIIGMAKDVLKVFNYRDK